MFEDGFGRLEVAVTVRGGAISSVEAETFFGGGYFGWGDGFHGGV